MITPSVQDHPHATTRVRHCDRCGTHLRGVDRLYGRCAPCRVGDDGKVSCPDCHGTGTVHYLWHGEPEAEYCTRCGRTGRLTPEELSA